MIRILKAYGIPSLLLRAIEATYTGTTAKVVTQMARATSLRYWQESYKTTHWHLFCSSLYSTLP